MCGLGEGTYDSEVWCEHACDLGSQACAAGSYEDDFVCGSHIDWVLNP
jgi:hypothetical protein